ncbi:MAG: prolipoprotein diacylglyceryl transferase [Kiloniellales bacterium]|nr:prolipoprotein diacylglyceryl transferase [Kiloniellales bacterium]
MLLAIPFPNIDPVALEIGPLAIRWYSLAYVVGLLLAWRYCLWLAGRSPQAEMGRADPPGSVAQDVGKPRAADGESEPTALEVFRARIDDFLLWATLGVVLGGRLGYVLFYKPSFYLEHPLQVLFVWEGGMSFHGGLLGVALAMIFCARSWRIPLFQLTDVIAAAAPIGLLLGRVANFINGELYGRPTDFWLAMVFPTDPLALPRHPSQLYEAALEGLLLFCLLFALALARGLYRPGLITGLFLAGYAFSRMAVELVREPDAHLGLLFGGATMGQVLSFPMAAGGAALVIWALMRPVQRARP